MFPSVPLTKVVKPVERPEVPVPGVVYRQIGVRLWGEGAYERDSIDGAETKYKTFSRMEENDIVLNKIWARNGSIAIITGPLAGTYGSSEFPTFTPNKNYLEPRWFHWLTKTKWFWDQCDLKSWGTSGKSRIRPERFLQIKIPLPPLLEQQRIVARIEALAAKIEEVRKTKSYIEKKLRAMMLSAFANITKNTPLKKLGNVAPLIRRSVEISKDKEYPEVGIRSFGKGTFHKPALNYLTVGTKRLFCIEPGDLLFNNVFAWEGAIAVAKKNDEGRYGSHRFITCVPRKGIVTPEFLCFYLLSSEGLQKIGEASPGGAGRNRTLGLKKLAEIEVPVPIFEKQLWFNNLQSKVEALLKIQNQTATELNALLPAILQRAFRGDL